jgi:GNAT superfamily N-acetyltransferase
LFLVYNSKIPVACDNIMSAAFQIIKIYFNKAANCYFYHMIIRNAVLNDIPAIMKVIAEVVPVMRASGNYQWDNTYPNAIVFGEDIASDQLWVADIDGEIAGLAAITTEQYPEYASVGMDINETAIVVHRLAVSTRHRGKGIAAALMQQAETEAIKRGIKTLRIDTNTANGATQKLFPKVGYIFKGEMGLSFRQGLRFYCYEKRLDQ